MPLMPAERRHPSNQTAQPQSNLNLVTGSADGSVRSEVAPNSKAWTTPLARKLVSHTLRYSGNVRSCAHLLAHYVQDLG